MTRRLPPRDTWWYYTKRFGTLAWYCVSRILILAGAMILTATILTSIFFPDLINTTHDFWEVREQSPTTPVAPLQMAPLLLKVCAQVVAFYGTGYVLPMALIATLLNARQATDE